MTLATLSDKAVTICSDAHQLLPLTAKVLGALSPEEIDTMCDADDLLEKSGGLATRLGTAESAIRDVVSRYIKPDLQDWMPVYARLTATYVESGMPPEEAERMLRCLAGDQAICFVLYELVYCWDPRSRAMSVLRIEDDWSADVLKGYLISRNRFYETCIDLLIASKAENWREWIRLWQYF